MKKRLNGLFLALICLTLIATAWSAVALADEAAACQHTLRLSRPRPGSEYPATCIAPAGYVAEWRCQDCDAYLGEYNQSDPNSKPDPNAHKFKETTVQGECTGAQPVTQKICTLCGYTETATNGSGHNWQTISVKAKTCGETDYTYEQCALCGMTRNYQYGSTVSNHTYTQNPVVVVRTPTCSQMGENTQKCDCGKNTKVIPVAMLPHAYGSQVTTEGNCTTKTKTSQFCTVCHYEQVISYGGYVHHYVEKDVLAATCTSAGTRESRCSVCGALNWSMTTPALGHSSTYWNSDATRHWKTCSRCNIELASGSHTGNSKNDYCTNRISCTTCGYLMSAGTNHTASTACDSGDDTYHDMKCKNCSYVSGRVKHTYTAVNGSCTEGLVCSACGHRTSGNASHALASAWVSAGASVHGRKCTVSGCTYMQTEAHTWSDWTITQQPTTSSTGAESSKCTKCSAVTVRSVPKLTAPAATQTAQPTATPAPTAAQTARPTATPTAFTAATARPTATPTASTAATARPTATPTASTAATARPTATPTASATATPASTQTSAATTSPAGTKSPATAAPTTAAPTATTAPVQPTDAPSEVPADDNAADEATDEPLPEETANEQPLAVAAPPTCADAGIPCTERSFSLSHTGLSVRVCAVCGNVTVDSLAEDAEGTAPVFTPVVGISVAGSAPEGELLLRAASLYQSGDESADAYYAFAAAWEANGQAQELSEAVMVSLPLAIGEATDETSLAVPTDSFKLVRVDVEDTAEVQTEVPFAYEDSILTFEMDCAAIYLLIPA